MKEYIPTRRRVLRAAVATGCSIWMPLVLAAEAKKVPQASVQYQTKPKGEQMCSTCMNFIAESKTCKLVEGNISPQGWCTLWAKKA